MSIVVITYNGTKMRYDDVLSFEFRSNQVSNWVNLKMDGKDQIYIHNVCVIKSVDELEGER